jgi:hypothetical protein
MLQSKDPTLRIPTSTYAIDNNTRIWNGSLKEMGYVAFPPENKHLMYKRNMCHRGRNFHFPLGGKAALEQINAYFHFLDLEIPHISFGITNHRVTSVVHYCLLHRDLYNNSP